MQFVKLTTVEGNSVFVNLEHISVIHAEDQGSTTVIFQDSTDLEVTEHAEIILGGNYTLPATVL